MPGTLLTDTISDHYLQVAALTPAGETSDIPIQEIATSTFTIDLTSPTVLFFLGLVGLGIIALIIVGMRDLNKVIMVLSLAFITSAIPVGMSLLSVETRLQSQAGPESTPKNVIVNQVTSTSFNLIWETDKPTAGAVRLRTTPSLDQIPVIYSESESDPVYSHYLNIDNLEPKTSYYFEILSSGNWYEDHGEPLEVTTDSHR